MKKIILFCISFLFILSSCNNFDESIKSDTPHTTVAIYTSSVNYDRVNVFNFEYNNHNYIYFVPVIGHGLSIIHDPDCKCYKNKDKNDGYNSSDNL